LALIWSISTFIPWMLFLEVFKLFINYSIQKQPRSSPFSPFNENVIIEIYHREQVSLGKNIDNEWITLRSRSLSNNTILVNKGNDTQIFHYPFVVFHWILNYISSNDFEV
jgi:hypothetical protein